MTGFQRSDVRCQGSGVRGQTRPRRPGGPPDRETAAAVGRRRGKPAILEVAAGDMARAGRLFYVSENGVWLTNEVPPDYLRGFPE